MWILFIAPLQWPQTFFVTPTLERGGNGTKSVLKRPAVAQSAGADESSNKFDAAMLLTEGDEELSRDVVNLDRGSSNVWKTVFTVMPQRS